MQNFFLTSAPDSLDSLNRSEELRRRSFLSQRKNNDGKSKHCLRERKMPLALPQQPSEPPEEEDPPDLPPLLCTACGGTVTSGGALYQWPLTCACETPPPQSGCTEKKESSPYV